MDNKFVLNEATLKRLPHFFVLIIVLLLGLPYVFMNLGMDFSVFADNLNSNQTVSTHIIESQIRGYFRQSLLQWTGFSLAAITVLLAFAQYRLANDKVALVIGLSVLFSGLVLALQTLVVDGLAMGYVAKNNMDALIWVISKSLNGLILFVGLLILLFRKDKQSLSIMTLSLLTTFIGLTAIALIYYTVVVLQLPDMFYRDSLLSRPYELVSIIMYLLLLIFIYPKAYQAYPNILTECIFYMVVTNTVVSIYLMLLSNAPYDSAYNVAYFLNVISYLIPCSCFVYKYVFSYSEVLNAQKRLRIQQEELKYLAAHDSLTNLYNRREFEELLDKSIANATRYNDSFGLLLIDIDNFKSTNDTFGHIHGDQLLKQFSQRLIKLVRKGDILSRVGGDEFTLILPSITSPSSARSTAEKILRELNDPYVINNKLITVTVSIGISICPLDGNTTEDLLRKADLAMYKAKNCGKNTYQFYTEQLSFLQHHESELEAHLRQALAKDEFELHYQPKYNLLNQKIIGAEILLRWHNEFLGNVPPSDFIPIAERTGLIIDLGNWVLRKSCEQIMQWQEQYSIILPFSVNISPLQLIHPQFTKNLKKILKNYKFPAKYLELEITESVLMDESNEMSRILKSISTTGIKLALDDFGTEYSSLNRLNTLPINILKIDKTFVAEIHRADDKVILVDIIIKLAKELGMSIVAEGIETKEQLDYLLAHECFIGQGFLFSKPLAADEFALLAYQKTTVQS
ncbi:MAG: EAL domain-containing protein [Legionella sp.]|jgi:diguanylate cyclase (GGDEF)-like protein